MAGALSVLQRLRPRTVIHDHRDGGAEFPFGGGYWCCFMPDITGVSLRGNVSTGYRTWYHACSFRGRGFAALTWLRVRWMTHSL